MIAEEVSVLFGDEHFIVFDEAGNGRLISAANVRRFTGARPGTTGPTGPTGATGPTGTGSWDAIIESSGNPFTTSSTSLVTITGLASATLTSGANYEFEAVLLCSSTGASGMAVGLGVSGGTASAWLLVSGPTGTQTGATTVGVTGPGLASGVFLNAASAKGVIVVKGYANVGTGGNQNLVMQMKSQGGSGAACYIGSSLKYRAL